MSFEPVVVRREPVVLPTYEPLPPDRNPMFLEKRVYQGSSGKVYPLPFYNRIAEARVDRSWDAVHVENAYIRVMILPELGGRIHIGQDKTNGYDFFYRQNVIKPALVGLAGPWASGGVEFNWPQHHRPATFMPVEVEIEAHPDGSKTVWLSDHDPMERMKGMHGVCLHPDRALIELKVRAYNRTPLLQTFLWWANVATHVHEAYQSIFPPDVTVVADHAKRAMTRFPLCEDHYYGVNYAERAKAGTPPEQQPRRFRPPHLLKSGELNGIPAYAANDLSWYANIPVPTSYMCLGSQQDFSGGYDHFKRAGLVQIANHHIAPGKKQWTWGNQEFGYAWDRNLTDTDGPYVELMLGVYTDNQPDFSFLQPGETKSWSVYWYPVKEIGPPQAANVDAAVSLRFEKRLASVGVAVTTSIPAARIELRRGATVLRSWTRDLVPGVSFLESHLLPPRIPPTDVTLRVSREGDREVVSFRMARPEKNSLPAPATEPVAPRDVPSTDELNVIALHLAQYRHATRSPVPYWEEILRRDAGDARANNGLGLWCLRRGEFPRAEAFFRAAIHRLTSRNANPYDGEPYYNLGVALSYQDRFDDAYGAFYKATWNQSWQAAGFHALAEIDCRRSSWAVALDHLDRSLRLNTDNLRARNLRVLTLRQLGRSEEADHQLRDTLALDPLDAWARWLRDGHATCDTQTRLDMALDYARAGLYRGALEVLSNARPEPISGTEPLIWYYRAFFSEKMGAAKPATDARRRAPAAPVDYCFPARLEEIAILQSAIARNPRDARAPYYLGNLYYDRRRQAEAIPLWEKSARLDGSFSIVWRNLGIAFFNIRKSKIKAVTAYERALRADPTDARLFYERDQLWKRLGQPAGKRLREFDHHESLVRQRDDAVLEWCSLLNQAGEPERALAVIESRRFQPWEGGEGMALGQYVRAHLQLGRAALGSGRGEVALAHFNAALEPAANLGEARHLLANSSNITFWLGEANAAMGEAGPAIEWWRKAAAARGDFTEMSVRSYSEMSYYSGLSLQRLGRKADARALFRAIARYADELAGQAAKIDYFATSLPTMLLFDDDLTHRQHTLAQFLRAQAELGLGRVSTARRRLLAVLQREPSHAGASDLLAELTT
ncbi:MAG: DUF5107 domain-containing protein [Opitutus sp.]